MSNEDPTAVYKIVAFIFADRNRAVAISEDSAATERFETYRVVAHAVVEVDDKGKSHFQEGGRAVLGAGLGLVAGGLLGLVGGPAGLLLFAAGGAVIGAKAGQDRGRPIPTEDMERLAAQMEPDSSALLVLVGEAQVETLVDSMTGYGARVVVLSVSDEVSGEIHQAAALPGESSAMAGSPSDTIYRASAIPGQVTK